MKTKSIGERTKHKANSEKPVNEPIVHMAARVSESEFDFIMSEMDRVVKSKTRK